MSLSVRIERYDLPLREPHAAAGILASRRTGYLVRARDADGNVGLGEAAPLDWSSTPAAIDAVGRSLERMTRAIGGADLEAEDLATALDADGSAIALVFAEQPAAAVCGMQTALLDLVARRARVAMTTLLGGEAGRRVRVNGLVVAETAEAVGRRAHALVDAGFETLKLKVGGRDVGADLERVAAARAAATGGRRLVLRLDANRAWSEATARTFLTTTLGAGVEYVEEPLAAADPRALERLRRATGVAIALDESIGKPADVETYGGCCDVVVLKLARIGGPLAARAVARAAHARGLSVVVTDGLETRIGRAAALHTAAACASSERSVGLAGAFSLDEDDGAGGRAAPWIDVSGPGIGIVEGRLES